jgi:hypothetical protein
MSFELFAFEPCAELAPLVETIWGVRGAADFSVEAVLPNGAVELMTVSGDRPGYGTGTGTGPGQVAKALVS